MRTPGLDLVEAVPMPPDIHAWVTDFVARHHVERPSLQAQARPVGTAGRPSAKPSRWMTMSDAGMRDAGVRGSEGLFRPLVPPQAGNQRLPRPSSRMPGQASGLPRGAFRARRLPSRRPCTA